MQVKTFTGATAQELLARIKAEMGPEAVILGSRTYRKNGVVHHEITAGLERPEASAQPVGAGWNEWRKDWQHVKEQLFALMKPAMRLDRLTPRQRVALEYLQREGVSDAVAVDLYQRLTDAPGASVLESLCRMVPVRPWSREHWPQRLHVLAGPYGAGKTTTALRLALHWRREAPETRIAFINADCLRGNGRLVLRHWAELSGFTYMEAPDKPALEQALAYVEEQGAPIVVKADGLAAGKGVFVADNAEEALAFLHDCFDGAFGSAGAKVLIEECLYGEEASILALCDGKTIVPLVSSQDHKRVGDGDTGLNTGGMGAYSPAPVVDDGVCRRGIYH